MSRLLGTCACVVQMGCLHLYLWEKKGCSAAYLPTGSLQITLPVPLPLHSCPGTPSIGCKTMSSLRDWMTTSVFEK